MSIKNLFMFCFVTVFFVSCASAKKNEALEVPTAEITSISLEKKTENINKSVLQKQIANDIDNIKKNDDYILQPGDLVDIKVFMEEEMDRTLRISSNGTITYPLIGNVKISGVSLSEAEEKIAKKLKQYIKNPQVSMLIKEYSNKTVYVLGQVKKPSAIMMPPEKSLTVLEAISSVGGFTDIANTSKVKILRMENGKQKSIDVDITAITKQGNKSLDVTLQPGDVLFVPQSIF